jgi:hypothetical protein
MKMARQSGLNAGERLRDRGRGKRFHSRLFWILNTHGSTRDQALALLSTARSERSA